MTPELAPPFKISHHTIRRLTPSIQERPKRLFKQKTADIRISLSNFHPLSLNVLGSIPVARAFFVRVARTDGFGEKGGGLRILTTPAVILVFDGEVNFPSSLKGELGRSRILRSFYSNGFRNPRVKASCQEKL
ncbi:hypothetical protein AVEN_148917-1 [Araneus ventricosus]|uniref:Uncharacterized protein n=1 Tax=Araneus ventricosus TaxID=182803 RepID=A0A4Y2DJZ9_ARAVE|nr:hypothetical protein AVEN_148917-1 [Araneus ventricosus]